MFGRKNSTYYNRSLGNIFSKFLGEKKVIEENMPDHEVLQYLQSSYPHNHNYVLNQGKLIPGRRLAKRYSAITSNYPAGMQTLLDLSCSKGYFTLDAIESYGCKSSMGIDVVAKELEACAAVKKYLGNETSHFEEMRLHELALQIDDFGGPFDTALVINSYQYLYFGSNRFKEAYLSHNDIFRDLRKVCKGRVIFNNRIELEKLQRYPAKIATSTAMTEIYDTETVFVAASEYFKVDRIGKIGKYPIWTMDAL